MVKLVGSDLNIFKRLVLNFFFCSARLKDAGGYELLRATNGRLLEVIPLPPDGYSVAYLRDVAQQAKIYIRPIQKYLPLELAASSIVSCMYNF